jgi:hypothetical protein
MCNTNGICAAAPDIVWQLPINISPGDPRGQKKPLVETKGNSNYYTSTT